jgi:RimJ/RimL family protein N-acetyltransferase
MPVEERGHRWQPSEMNVFLETARLVLRAFTADDLDNLVDLDGDPEVTRYLTGGKPTPRAQIESETLPRFLSRCGDLERYAWAAVEKASGEFLGWFALRPIEGSASNAAELGYRLRRSAWMQGFATEGSRALIRKGFTDLDLHRIFAETMAVNLASRRVMEKVGMTLLRTFHQEWPDPIEGTEYGEVEYEIDKADWLRQQHPVIALYGPGAFHKF